MTTKTDLDLKRLDAISDARALAEPVSSADAAFFADHRGAPELVAMAALEDELAALGQQPAPDLGPTQLRDERIVAAVVAGPAPSGRSLAWVLAPVAAAAALILFIRTEPSPPADEARGAPAIALAAPEHAPAPAAAAPDGFQLEGRTLALHTETKVAPQACVVGVAGRACAVAPSRVRPAGDALELRAGVLEITSDPGFSLGAGGVTAQITGRARVTVEGDVVVVVVLVGGTHVVVGDVEHALEAGEEWTNAALEPAEAKAERPPLTAQALIEQARDAAVAGDLAAATRAYGQLVKLYPDSPEAHAVLPSLGRLQLERGRDRAALRAFTRYLARPGRGAQNAEEARLGRIKALRRLGRTGELETAVADFLKHHPQSPHAKTLR